MIDLNGIIESNIQPFKLSQFRNKFKILIKKF